MSAQEIHFPTEEEGMEGIKINIKHDLGSGGDPTFSGAFHGAGSGGVEPVSPKSTGLARADSLGLDKAAGVRRGPGTAGAHPAMVSGGGSGVGVGGDESPASSPTASKAGAGSQDAHEGQGVVESAKEAVAGAAQSAKEAVGL